MPEKQYPGRVVYIEFDCDKCGTGKMVYTGGQTDHPVFKFVHVCNQCSAVLHAKHAYPVVQFEKVEMKPVSGGKKKESKTESGPFYEIHPAPH